MDYKSILEIISISVAVIGSVWAAYLKLKDQISQIQIEARVTSAITQQMSDEIKTLNKDVHNIALIIGTKRALAEEKKTE